MYLEAPRRQRRPFEPIRTLPRRAATWPLACVALAAAIALVDGAPSAASRALEARPSGDLAGQATIRRDEYGVPHITAPTEEKAALKRDLMANARRRILLADSSKYGAWSLFNIAPLASLTDIVTDAHLPDKTREALETLSPQLIIAD